MNSETKTNSAITENLKKGTTELLVLAILAKSDTHIHSIVSQLDELSGGECKIAFPYGVIYRLLDNGYITEIGKRIDENRRRQYYHLTENGKAYYENMKRDYFAYINGVGSLFNALGVKDVNFKSGETEKCGKTG